MGVISDAFKAQIDEMRERHAQTDRELIAARDAVFRSLAEIKAIVKDFEDA